jgi:predicted enzyme involved in methoxymalonyl-ACP biosynthesis
MIGVVIARPHAPRAWLIDTWLMSCRVLGRRVEEAMLAELVAAARAAGIERIDAKYLPTAKNGMVAEHFDNLGFGRTANHFDGARDYALDVAGYETPSLPFTVLARDATGNLAA